MAAACDGTGVQLRTFQHQVNKGRSLAHSTEIISDS